MIPWFQYTVIPIGPLSIQVWGLFVALGILTSFGIIWKRAAKFGMEKEKALDLAFYLILFGLLGARLFHVFMYEPVYFWQNPLDAFKIWQGGMSSFGGIAGAISAFLFYYKKNKIGAKEMIANADLFSFASLYGWLVGRLGCLMIHDHLGRQSNSWLAILTPDGARLETSLLEILALIPLAGLFALLTKRKLPDGFYFYALISYYGILRFILDFFRATDISTADTRLLGLTPAQYFAIIATFAGAKFLLKMKRKTTA